MHLLPLVLILLVVLGHSAGGDHPACRLLVLAHYPCRSDPLLIMAQSLQNGQVEHLLQIVLCDGLEGGGGIGGYTNIRVQSMFCGPPSTPAS